MSIYYNLIAKHSQKGKIQVVGSMLLTVVKVTVHFNRDSILKYSTKVSGFWRPHKKKM
jgi:hypothetical protein